jgi:hypothetical protein
MPLSEHRIVISDPVNWLKTINAMVAEKQFEAFSQTFTRLLELCMRYLAEDTADDRKRLVTIWANHREEHDYYFWIREEPMNFKPGDQAFKTLLVGGMHYHKSDKTWTLNT